MNPRHIPPELAFSLVATLPLPVREPQYFGFEDLEITNKTKAFLSTYPSGIYRHQKQGIARIIAG
jgi:hypothetical protein